MNKAQEALVLGVVGGAAAALFIYTFDHDETIAPLTPLTPATPTVTATQSFGPGWTPVTQEMADSLSEGDDTPPENADTRDWESCMWHVGDTSVIICPDGFSTTS